MKFKEILRNKWGWAGGIIAVIMPKIISLNIIPQSLIFLKNPLTDIIISFVLGFILGLIAQKLWRKFK